MPDYSQIEHIAGALRTSRVTVVLGSGASLDPANDAEKPWQADLAGMPSAAQLARILSQSFDVDDASLSLTAQLVETLRGGDDLRTTINEIFSRSAAPLPCHEFCASLADWRLARRPAEESIPKALPPRFTCPLFITTNYDALLEDALRKRGVPFDLLYYDGADHPEGARLEAFRCDPESVDKHLTTEELAQLGSEHRVCVVKIHGSVATPKQNSHPPSFVITEDDYITFLASVRWDNFFPAGIASHLARCHYLFLGHSLSDWNLRVMLHQITQKGWRRRTDFKIWVVKKKVVQFEQDWAATAPSPLALIEANLAEFIPRLEEKVTCLAQQA